MRNRQSVLRRSCTVAGSPGETRRETAAPAGGKTVATAGAPSGPTPTRHLPVCGTLGGTIGGVVGETAPHVQLGPHLQHGVALANLAAQQGLSALERQQAEPAEWRHRCAQHWHCERWPAAEPLSAAFAKAAAQRHWRCGRLAHGNNSAASQTRP